MDTQTIKADFLQVLNDVFSGMHGITLEQAITATTAIIQESGKYARQDIAIKTRSFDESASDEPAPASESQKNALRKWKVKFSEDISKKEASELLDKVISEANARKKGR